MLIALAVVAAALAAVFLVPVTVVVTLTTNEGDSAIRARIRLRWLAFSWLSGTSSSKGRATQADVRTPSRRRRRRRGPAFDMRAALASPGLVRHVLRLATNMAQRLRPDRFAVRGRVGFEDPADTGIFLGWFYALPLGAGAHRCVRIQPEFGGEVLEGRASLQWSRSLASLLWPLVRFLVSPVAWRAVRAGLSARS